MDDTKIDVMYLKQKILSKYNSIEEFISKAPYSRRSFFYWFEKGVIPSNKLKKIADLLNVKVDEFYRKESDANEQEGT